MNVPTPKFAGVNVEQTAPDRFRVEYQGEVAYWSPNGENDMTRGERATFDATVKALMDFANGADFDQNGYVVFFNGQQVAVYAASMLDAVTFGRAHFKPAKSKAHMVHAHLAEKAGQPVVHVAVN